MNEVMNAILTRRSIRSFTDKPISKEILKDIAVQLAKVFGHAEAAR